MNILHHLIFQQMAVGVGTPVSRRSPAQTCTEPFDPSTKLRAGFAQDVPVEVSRSAVFSHRAFQEYSLPQSDLAVEVAFLLAVTTTRLSLASRRQLAGQTSERLAPLGRLWRPSFGKSLTGLRVGRRRSAKQLISDFVPYLEFGANV